LLNEPNVFVDGIGFVVNPIDALYTVHQSLLTVHRGVILKKLGREEATEKELGEILGFDYLFAF
jgi:hypothetical protein